MIKLALFILTFHEINALIFVETDILFTGQTGEFISHFKNDEPDYSNNSI